MSTVFYWHSNEIMALKDRLDRETGWAYTPVSEQREGSVSRTGVPSVAVTGWEILTGRGPVVLRTDDDLDRELARRSGGGRAAHVPSETDFLTAYKVLFHLVEEEYGEDLVHTLTIHSSATDEAIEAIKRVHEYAGLHKLKWSGWRGPE